MSANPTKENRLTQEFIWVVTAKCPKLASRRKECEGCFNHSLTDKELTDAERYSVMDNMITLGTPKILITGGGTAYG